jgi:hypothetical protein
MTKQRQSYDNVVSASGESATSSSVNPTNKPKPNQRPIRTEPLDVARLNQLIKVIDKTWILPRSGSREPVGSNFQALLYFLIYKSDLVQKNMRKYL